MTNMFRVRANDKAKTRAANRDRNADFKMGQNSMDAIFGNLRTTQAGQARKLSRTNNAILGRMTSLANRHAGQIKRDISGGADRAKTLFGAGLGKAVDNQLLTGKGVANANAHTTRGSLQAAVKLARGGNDALAIQQEASKEAGNAADFMLNQALRVRAQIDAEAKAERDMARMQLREEQRAAEREERGVGGANWQSAAGTLTDFMTDPTTTPESAKAKAEQLASVFNLGPEARARLQGLVAGGFNADGQSLTATQPTDEFGQPLQTKMDDDDKASVKRDVINGVKSGKSLAALQDEAKALLSDDEGNPAAPNSLIEEMMDYIEMLYLVVKPTYKEVSGVIQTSEKVAAAKQYSGK